MMITIHGLPITTKYQDLKILIKRECNISDFILDCLVSENDGTKKVRVGLTDDSEGNHVMKCLNGYRMSGNILKLMPVGKSASANVPQQRSFEARDNYQARNEYPSQGFSDRNKVVEPQTAPWTATNQWSNQPAHSQIPSSYSYQQPTNTAYGQQANPSIKPQFEPRINISTARVQQQTPSYGYNPKSNLISLGPQRNLTPTLREVPEANQPIQSRYSNQNYGNQSEKPVTIMKDNFQGPAQYNVAPHTQGSGTYQTHNQPSPWAFQQAQKQPAVLDKKPYDDRKYPQPNQIKPMVETPNESAYQGYDKSRQYSPQRRAYDRDIQPERRASPTERHISHSGRNTMPGRISPTNREAYDRSRPKMYSPDRRISPNRGMRPGHISPSTRHMVTGKRISPSGRRMSPGRHVSPAGRQISPGRRFSPSGRRISPSGRRISPSGRRISPSGRRTSPSGRRISPSARRISPSGRRISPSGRRISPSGRPIVTDRNVPHGKKFTQFEEHMPSMRAMSPGRKISPARKISPSHRRLSPQAKKEDYMRSRRISPPAHSPMDRRMPSRQSPNRGMQRSVETHSRQESSRGQARYSPPHQFPEKTKDYPEDRRSGNIKSVRPAYEPPTQASNEAMYSGGYRPNVHDVQYPTTHTLPRQDWQDREKAFPPKPIIEDRERRDVPRLQKFDMQRVSDQQRPMEQETKRSRSHSSRSPRRDRSPIRDRYRRHSPSPRSPRRSWALEKRRSPQRRETPPPPVWPGNNSEDYSQQSRPIIPAREVEKHVPVWETRDKRRDDYTAENRRDFEEQIRIRKEMEKWKPIPQSNTQESSRMIDEDRMHKESKFVKKDFETRRDYREDDMRKPHTDRLQKGYQRQDREEDIRYKSEHEQKDDIPRKREEYAGRIEEKKKEILQKQEQLQKEIDEVYKRAVDFTKKAELYKKTEHKKESHDSDRDRDGVSGPKHYERYKQDSYEKQSRNVPFKEYNRSYASRSDEKAGIEQSKYGELPADVKAKRNKAILEISEKIMHKYGSTLSSEMHKRVFSELKWTLNRKLNEMFGNKDVSFIEIIVKFNSSCGSKDEKNMFDEIMYSMSGHVRNAKRTTQDDSDVPAKMPRRSPEPNLNNDQMPRAHDQQISDWSVGTVGMMPLNVASNAGFFLNAPLMVPMPSQYQLLPSYQEHQPTQVKENKKDGYSLYLCKDDFQPIDEFETATLKEFLIQQLIKVTETTQGWAPDFTLTMQNSVHRHEVVTRDERSKNWLLSLDFSDFKEFNVLVYTTEELWYERAAIWLPGHSRCRSIEPLTKLKLQNKRLEGVNIGKWKLVKKVVTDKGTRVYVDMPPSSARAMEKHKMMLSYELQKVNVFLKAVAIDKDAFDAGLNEPSITILPSPGSGPMPSLGQDQNIIKIGVKGNKPLSLVLARKLKDFIIFKLFKYHQLNGKSRTDFIKYGFCQPGYLGILPENEESRKWICSLEIGKLNRQQLFIVGADDNKTKYFTMTISIPKNCNLNTAAVTERLRQSNKGVKGVNFSLWRNQKILRDKAGQWTTFEVEMDLESVETISKMNYQLDYVADGHDIKSLSVDSKFPRVRLEEMIAKYKAELSDTYNVENMELASSDSEDDVVCLD